MYFEEKEIILTKEQEEQYKKYVQEYHYRRNCSREGFVDWSLANHNGGIFDKKEWLEKPYLHNCKGTNY